MSSICDSFHQFLPSKKTLLKDINIPPRKLLNRHDSPDFFSDSPRFSFSDDTLLQKFLPCNNGRDDGDEDDSYSSDYFRIYEFKVRRCNRSRSHDWTDCPFAHPGEKARRRDPRRYHYSGNVCPEFRRGGCSRGDSCEFAHGVFECWLHPGRYRTEACKDGKNCTRKVCFFAHSPRQLRILPVNSPEFQMSKKQLPISVSGSNHCCLFCHCGASSSPTSPLLGMSHLSPPLSPPLSPAKPQSVNTFTSNSRNNEAKLAGLALTEMMSSLEAMSLNEANKTSPAIPPWIDVSFSREGNQQHFILSPSTPRFSRSMSCLSRNLNYENKVRGEIGGFINSDPDVGWVDELLM